MTLDTAKRLQRQLGGRVKTRLMRSDDRFIDLDDRAARASGNSNTILVSIHYNSSSAAIRGPETYYWRVDSHGLATRLQRAMVAVSPAESGNRGMVRRRLRLTRNPDIPCVLVELGYLSNPQDVQSLLSPEWRARAAAAMVKAIDAFFAGYGRPGGAPSAENGVASTAAPLAPPSAH